MESPEIKNRLRRFFTSMPVATVGFICFVGLLTYCCSRLFGGVLMQELHRYDSASGNALTAPASPVPSPSPETGKPVALLLTPGPAATASVPTLTDTPAPSALSETVAVTPAPSPSPSLRPVVKADVFTKERVDFLFYGMDAEGKADWIHLVALREDSCTVLSVPKNTLTDSGGILADAGSFRTLSRRLGSVFPVECKRYVALQTAGVAPCVDTFGSVLLDGTAYDGKAVDAYLRGEGQDEMLRITRQQAFLKGYLRVLKSAGVMKLLSSKFILQDYVDSNFTIGQLVDLYSRLNGFSLDNVTFLTLPVDSTSVDGQRCYQPDIAMVNAIAEELYPAEEETE